jgi:hypothetical protein
MVFNIHCTLPGSGIVQSVECLGNGLGELQFDSGYGYEIFLFSKTSDWLWGLSGLVFSRYFGGTFLRVIVPRA